MELSSPSSNSRAVVGGGHYKFQNGHQPSESENYQHQSVSDSSDEEGNSFNELGKTYDTDHQHEKFFNDVTTMVLKGLKRKRRRKSMRKQTRKRSKLGINLEAASGDEFALKAYSRCNAPYLYEVIQSFSKCESKCVLIREAGFGSILEFDGTSVPRAFVQWIADRTNTSTEEVCFGYDSIKLSAKFVTMILGTPAGKYEIQTTGEDGKISFLGCFGLSELPPIKFFGKKIMTEDLPDDMFLRCFLVVVLSTFLCPNSSTYPSTKYLGALVDIEKIKDMNFSKLTHDWMIHSIKKYQTQKGKQSRVSCTLGGCIYGLAVRCLDQFDFGKVEFSTILPRILVWKGDMIIDFSKMVMQKNSKHGMQQLKPETETCYNIEAISDTSDTKVMDTMLLDLRSRLDCCLGHSVSCEAKQKIAMIFQNYMKSESEHCWEKAKCLTMDVIASLTTSCEISRKQMDDYANANFLASSEHTEIVKDSQDSSNNCPITSACTEKVEPSGNDSQGVESVDDKDGSRRNTPSYVQSKSERNESPIQGGQQLKAHEWGVVNTKKTVHDKASIQQSNTADTNWAGAVPYVQPIIEQTKVTEPPGADAAQHVQVTREQPKATGPIGADDAHYVQTPGSLADPCFNNDNGVSPLANTDADSKGQFFARNTSSTKIKTAIPTNESNADIKETPLLNNVNCIMSSTNREVQGNDDLQQLTNCRSKNEVDLSDF